MEKYIQTVTGLFPIDKLEKVLLHEHIVLGYAGWFYDPRYAEFDHDTAQKQTLERLKRLSGVGVNLVVDPCPIELGRNPEFMREMSQKSGVQIMCSTGFDLQARGYMSAIRGASAEEICDMYMYEIENGIGSEKVKPGIIKVATGHNQISDYEMRCLEAASKASLKSGLAIITHTEKTTMGPEQIRAFKSFGVAPARCAIGHSGANPDLSYHKAILDEGCYLGFDRFGNEWHGDDYYRTATLIALIHMGFSDRIYIGTDSVAYLLKALPGNRNYENWDPMYLFERIIPKLKERGATKKDIDNLTGENAKRFLSGN